MGTTSNTDTTESSGYAEILSVLSALHSNLFQTFVLASIVKSNRDSLWGDCEAMVVAVAQRRNMLRKDLFKSVY